MPMIKTMPTIKATLFVSLFFVANLSLAGTCNYTQENMFSGPYKVCKTNVDTASCETLGATDQNANAQFAEGECDTSAYIGFCESGESKVYFYDGKADDHEVSCTFAEGTWNPK